MVETAGTKLRRVRQMRQLSLEDASRATKIRPRQLADLESDEYSNFANLAYAKSYLIAYGKFLKVDTRPYMEAFADASTFGMDDYQYLSDKPVGVYRATRRSTARNLRPKRKQIIVAGAIIGLMAITVFGRVTYTTYQRLGDLDRIAARHEALAQAAARAGQPAAVAAPSATPVVAPAAPDADNTGLAAVRAEPVDLPALAGLAAGSPAAETAAATPTVPLPGDGTVVREMLSAPAARKSGFDPTVIGNRAPATQHSPMYRVDDPHPQTVVNNGPTLPLN